MIVHVVLFKLNTDGLHRIAATRDVLLGMQGKIPQLRFIEVGIDLIRSERSFDLALITKFDTFEDMRIYQGHPVHQEVLKHMRGIMDSAATVDYEVF